jgi:hypothetical protein
MDGTRIENDLCRSIVRCEQAKGKLLAVLHAVEFPQMVTEENRKAWRTSLYDAYSDLNFAVSTIKQLGEILK